MATALPDSAVEEYQKLCDLLERRSDALDKKWAEFEAEKADWEQKKLAFEAEREEATQALEDAHALLSDERETFSSDLEEVRTAKETVEKERRVMRAEYEAQLERLNTIKDDLDDQEAAVDQSTEVEKALNLSAVELLDEEVTTLKQTISNLQVTVTDLSTERDTLIDELATAQEELDRISEITKQQCEIQDNLRAIADLKQQRSELELEVDELSTMRDEEMTRIGLHPNPTPVPSATSEATTREALAALQFDLSVFAEEKEALVEECEQLTQQVAQLSQHRDELQAARPYHSSLQPLDSVLEEEYENKGARAGYSARDHSGEDAYDDVPEPRSVVSLGSHGEGEVNRKRLEVQPTLSNGGGGSGGGGAGGGGGGGGSSGAKKDKSLMSRLLSKIGHAGYQVEEERWYGKWAESWAGLPPWEVVSGNVPHDCLAPSEAARLAAVTQTETTVHRRPILRPAERVNADSLRDADFRASHSRPGGPSEPIEEFDLPSDDGRVSPSMRSDNGGGASPVSRDSPRWRDAKRYQSFTVPAGHPDASLVWGSATDPTPKFMETMRLPDAARLDPIRKLLAHSRYSHSAPINWLALPHPCRALVRHAWVSQPAVRRMYGFLLLDTLVLGYGVGRADTFLVEVEHVVRMDRVRIADASVAANKSADVRGRHILHVVPDDGGETLVLEFPTQPLHSGWMADLRRCVSHTAKHLPDSNLDDIFTRESSFSTPPPATTRLSVEGASPFVTPPPPASLSAAPDSRGSGRSVSAVEPPPRASARASASGSVSVSYAPATTPALLVAPTGITGPGSMNASGVPSSLRGRAVDEDDDQLEQLWAAYSSPASSAPLASAGVQPTVNTATPPPPPAASSLHVHHIPAALRSRKAVSSARA